MGSAASTLTPEQSSKLTHILKEKYEKYQEEKLTDDEIRVKISEEYNHIVNELKKSHPAGGAGDANERSSRPSTPSNPTSCSRRNSCSTPTGPSAPRTGSDRWKPRIERAR